MQPNSKEKAKLKDLYRTLEYYKSELVKQNSQFKEFISSWKLLKVKKKIIKHTETK